MKTHNTQHIPASLATPGKARSRGKGAKPSVKGGSRVRGARKGGRQRGTGGNGAKGAPGERSKNTRVPGLQQRAILNGECVDQSVGRRDRWQADVPRRADKTVKVRGPPAGPPGTNREVHNRVRGHKCSPSADQKCASPRSGTGEEVGQSVIWNGRSTSAAARGASREKSRARW